ncbi:transmembrane protein 235 isoform X2 [Notolabrus celidotus]|uniref:transmembrane protein 235 isoform X2 n=1 Tax=Notolabrus celidotus TaxID=1203425 RepID=UPI0014901E16|nr:transmembrane protein 235 isoform X2 [Notolabrus celidotus]
MRYGLVVLAAGFAGLLTFSLLALAIGTDYWYIIDVNKDNHTGPDDLSSHSGLWRIIEGANRSSVIPSFTANMSSLSETEKQLLGLHKVVVIILPLSLVLLVFGWIFGLVSSLACSPSLLVGSASYFLFCKPTEGPIRKHVHLEVDIMLNSQLPVNMSVTLIKLFRVMTFMVTL